MDLTIVIPAYNIEDYIETMMNSLLHQTEQKFEVIIVDDGSVDNTYRMAEAFMSAHQWGNCRIIKTSNGGVSSARNRGLLEAEGKYVVFLDGDDYVSNDLVESIYEGIQEQEAEIFCWGFDLVNEDQTTRHHYFDEFPYASLEMTGVQALHHIIIDKKLRIWTASIAYKREYLRAHYLEYTEQCINGEDQEFIYKALARAPKVIFLNRVLSFYLQRSSSISYVYNVRKFDAIQAFKRATEFFKATPGHELGAISDYIEHRLILENYFYNLKTCLSGARNTKIKDLLKDIEVAYPGLNQEMLAIMKHYKSEEQRRLPEIEAFIISPTLFHKFILFKEKLRGTRNSLKQNHKKIQNNRS